MNGPDRQATRLRAAVRRALAADDLEPMVRRLLELRFPPEGQAGASLGEAAAALGWSPAMAAHIEFAALCAIAATHSGGHDSAPAHAGGVDLWMRRARRRP